MNIEKLHAAIAAICPIDGLDSSGKIYFKTEATNFQKLAAESIFANWTDPVEVKEILRSTIIERLESVNKFDDAIAVMEQPENLKAKYKWFSMVAIRIDDSDVRAVLNAISVNPDEILY